MVKKSPFSIALLISVLSVLLFSFSWFNIAYASPAILKLSPPSAQYIPGDSFNVELNVDTGGVGVSAVEVKINYDPAVLEYKALGYVGSPFEAALGSPQISPGSILVARATYSEGGFKGTGKVAIITFKALKVADSTSVTIDKASSEVAEYGTGKNLLTSVQSGLYSVGPLILYISRSQTAVKTDKIQALADGKDTITLTVTVRDAQGKLIKDKKPIVTVSGSGNKISDTTLKDDDWITTITSTVAEKKTITVTVEKGILLGTIYVTFFTTLPPEEVPPEEIPPEEVPPPEQPPVQPPPPVSFWSFVGQSLPLVILLIIGIGGGLALLSAIGYWIYTRWYLKPKDSFYKEE